jgi:ABC-type multidrug transport system ATPase subunit
MRIELESVSKRYALEWVLKNVSFIFESKKSYAITGHNGSGKSTLIKLISGIESASKGKLTYSNHQAKETSIQLACSKMSYVAPYQEVIEEFTIKELASFHFALLGKKDHSHFFDLIPTLPQNKLISEFSSGMKQRVKLALAFSSESELILLDEPTTTLDEEGISWYKDLCTKAIGTATVIVSSNQKHEYDFVDKTLHIADYK